MHSIQTRRAFLKLLSALGVAGFIPAQAFSQQTLLARAIPGTNEMLPVIGLGSSKPVMEIPLNGVEPLIQVIKMLVEYGGTVIDTSPREEEIDKIFGEVLMDSTWRDHLFVSTKINGFGKQTGIEHIEHNLRLYGKRPADLILVESMRDIAIHWTTLRERKSNGDVRYIGATVSNIRDHDQMEEFMRKQVPDIIQVNYSIAEPQAEERLLPLAADLGIAVITNRPFMNGAYFQHIQGHNLPDWVSEFDCKSWAQFTLKYTLANPAVTCVLTETTNPKNMLDNIGAAFGRFPDTDLRTRMRNLYKTISGG